MINYAGQVLNGPNGQSGSLRFIAVTGDRAITEADSGAVLLVSSAAVLTLPAATPAEGFYVEVIRTGAGAVSFAAGAGATVVSSAGATPGISAQYQGATCTKLSGEQWIVIGGIA